MKRKLQFALVAAVVGSAQFILAQGASSLLLPVSVVAGHAFSVQHKGGGKFILYIIGQGQVLRRSLQPEEFTSFPVGSITNAGHYLVVLRSATNGSTIASGTFDVVADTHPAYLSFLAKPSRLPVDQEGSITGAVYVFDADRNLIVKSLPVTFKLSSPGGALQKHLVFARNGVALTEMDSTAFQGIDNFTAQAGDIVSTRVIAQVPGDPCSLTISADRTGQELHVVTTPVKDCTGNAVPDGTIVTFTESYHGMQTTVDVPIKRGIAVAQIPFHALGTISVASGVVMGNQISEGR